MAKISGANVVLVSGSFDKFDIILTWGKHPDVSKRYHLTCNEFSYVSSCFCINIQFFHWFLHFNWWNPTRTQNIGGEFFPHIINTFSQLIFQTKQWTRTNSTGDFYSFFGGENFVKKNPSELKGGPSGRVKTWGETEPKNKSSRIFLPQKTCGLVFPYTTGCKHERWNTTEVNLRSITSP